MVWPAGNGQTNSDHKLERWAGGEVYTQTRAENGKVIVSTAVLAKREIFSNKSFMTFFFLYSLLTWNVIWKAVRTSQWKRVALSQSGSEEAQPGLEGGEQRTAKATLREFI